MNNGHCLYLLGPDDDVQSLSSINSGNMDHDLLIESS